MTKPKWQKARILPDPRCNLEEFEIWVTPDIKENHWPEGSFHGISYKLPIGRYIRSNIYDEVIKQYIYIFLDRIELLPEFREDDPPPVLSSKCLKSHPVHS